MYDRVITDVDPHMAAVAYHIPRKHFRIFYGLSACTLSRGTSRDTDPELLMDLLYKPGTVNSVSEAVAAEHIFISDRKSVV